VSRTYHSSKPRAARLPEETSAVVMGDPPSLPNAIGCRCLMRRGRRFKRHYQVLDSGKRSLVTFAMKLPPLNALRAFEAAARHKSFVKAAEEMYVSPAAVSRHVKNLEEHLSLRLFDRKAQGIVLTEVGRQLLPELSHAFQCIASAALRVRTM